MIDITSWVQEFTRMLTGVFGNRVWFVGLQGSYSRGEATDTSDIDMVVILDELTVADIHAYNAMLDSLPHRELICGFLSGKREILNWDTADLFQFCRDTTPIQGSLEAVLNLVDSDAVNRAIKMAACNLYHGCVHNMLHGKQLQTLQGLYKGASFAIQAICFQQTGRYIRHLQELMEVVSEEERVIVETFLKLKAGEPVDFDPMSETLFTWAGKWIVNT